MALDPPHVTRRPAYLHTPGEPWLVDTQPIIECRMTSWLLMTHLRWWQRGLRRWPRRWYLLIDAARRN